MYGGSETRVLSFAHRQFLDPGAPIGALRHFPLKGEAMGVSLWLPL